MDADRFGIRYSLFYTPATHGWSGGGSSKTDSFVFTQPYLYGASNGGDWMHVWASDGLREDSNFSMINAYDNVGDGATGNRLAVTGTVIVGDMPTGTANWTGVFGQVQVNAPLRTPGGVGFPGGVGAWAGTAESGWDYVRVNDAASQSLQIVYGHETNVAYAVHAGVQENIGLGVVDASDGPNVSWDNGNFPGLFTNSALYVDGGSWRYGLAFSKETGQWAFNPKATLIGLGLVQTAEPTVTPSLRAGLDFRGVDFTESALQLPSFGVGPDGDVSARTLSTGAVVQAQTAMLAGAVIDDAGTYTTWPRFSVSAPPMEGVTASVDASTLSARKIVGFGSTGRGYRVGDTLKPAGLTGAALPAYEVTSIDASGGIAGVSIDDPSNKVAVDNPPGNQLFHMVGGSGSGAVLHLAWAQNGDNSGYYPYQAVFAATGAGYAVGDTVTLVGDTGEAAVFRVTATSDQGGIQMDPALSISGQTGLQLQVAGNVTSIADGYHAVETSGDGSGASLLVGYGVSMVNITSGSGYLVNALPLISSSPSHYGVANILPIMNPVPASMVLNPGQKIYLDASRTMWLRQSGDRIVVGTGETRLFSIDGSGNIVARGRLTQGGEP
jgi:hypothetical protein